MMPIKFAICNELFQGWQLEDAFAFVKELGYDGVEIAPFTSLKVPSKFRERNGSELGNWRKIWAWRL